MWATVYDNIKWLGHIVALLFDLEKWKAAPKEMPVFIMIYIDTSYIFHKPSKSKKKKKTGAEKYCHHLW